MLVFWRIPALAAVVVIMAVAAGCGPAKTAGISTGGSSWTIVDDQSIPGIHTGSTSIMTLEFGSPQGVTVVVWGDVSTGTSSGATRDDHVFAEGSLVAAGGRRINYRCETRDGTVATVSVGGNDFDTTSGALFLVSTHSDPPQVRQLAADISSLPGEANALRDFALAHPEIAGFFTEAHQ